MPTSLRGRTQSAPPAETSDAFGDGVAWVVLAPIADPALVPALVAAALGLRLTSDGSPGASMGRVLHARQTLPLLDNCEHVLADEADLVAGGERGNDLRRARPRRAHGTGRVGAERPLDPDLPRCPGPSQPAIGLVRASEERGDW